MTNSDHARHLKRYLWTLELLGEALVESDHDIGSVTSAQLSQRSTAGIHEAIRIISQLGSEQCSRMLDGDPQLSNPGHPA